MHNDCKSAKIGDAQGPLETVQGRLTSPVLEREGAKNGCITA